MRHNPTDAEIRLWSRLRGSQLRGFRFRRQQPIGFYVVDFFCLEVRLIVEVDGGQHGEHNARDAARTEWLERRGYRLIRFWNNDVLARTDDVLATFFAALESTDRRRLNQRG